MKLNPNNRKRKPWQDEAYKLGSSSFFFLTKFLDLKVDDSLELR